MSTATLSISFLFNWKIGQWLFADKQTDYREKNENLSAWLEPQYQSLCSQETDDWQVLGNHSDNSAILWFP